jgi:hypothetical protein
MSAHAVPGRTPGYVRAVCDKCPHFQRSQNLPDVVQRQIEAHNGIYHPEILDAPEPAPMALEN